MKLDFHIWKADMKMKKPWCVKSKLQKARQTQGFRLETAMPHAEHRTSDWQPTFVMEQAPMPVSVLHEAVTLCYLGT